MNIDWTDEDRLAWEKTWKEPHMQLALIHLKLACLPDTGGAVVAANINNQEIAAQAYAFLQGKASMIEEIDKLKPQRIAKPLPAPFQTKRPPTEPE